MKIGKYISKFMKADDLRKPRLFTIASIEEEEVGDDEKLVMRVEETEQPIALGPTTLSQLAELFNPGETNMDKIDTDNWIGNTVVAFRDPSVVFGKNKVGGIRFRAPKVVNHETSETVSKKVEVDEVPF